MIRIKDYIFNENIITKIHKIDDVLNVYKRNGNIDYIKDATFEDIEWNYEQSNIKDDEYIELSNKYQKLSNRNEELEGENEKLKEELEIEINSSNVKLAQNRNKEIKIEQLETRIDKAIEYIENTYEKEYHKPKEEIKNFNLKNCTYEPSLVVLGILKGEENE